ncbi:FAD-dependent oxidoreductase [Mitsuaria sp. WAJ17]|uniref:flavin monoamine oxidase family protein n=1 Tax=Mitsuaria sp. WAJ17 TaxID=2761452 RepID=UPI0016036D16|nr:FAD-dependent oxidoreductase [Mitsuaria sp. WAJ17]MBB2484554.1 FAD-dependent oxidoreductase [Mitsuaria sp. WAJ17]
MRRRELLAALGSTPALLGGCTVRERSPLAGGWVGAHAERGHLLREAGTRERLLRAAREALPRRTDTLIVGGGVSGLACARRLVQAGRDFTLLELEDEAGGNARGHQMGGFACPLGAHYLPVPGPQAPEVAQLLEELGVSRQQAGRTVHEERFLCHSPQERLFFEGQWHEGLLPPPDSAATRAQYQRFGQAVTRAQALGFAMPSQRAPWTPDHAALDAQPFAHWLDAQGLDDPRLRWYLDYCCRDDYGAGAGTVSAWAGLHYFASRHGFHGGESRVGEEEREAVLTWPEGNAWLTRHMSRPLGDRLRAGRLVLRVEQGRHQVEVLAWNASTQTGERWTARQLVMATPLFIAAHLVDQAPPALREAVALQPHAPWLVANLQLASPLLERSGAGLSWDNVIYGSEQLGYVDAGHQRLDPTPGPTVLTAYWALPATQRAALLTGSWEAWAQRVLGPLRAVHPDLPDRLQRMDLMRWGHAMSIPVPGLRGSPALGALRLPQGTQGRLHFAHSDLAAYSVFEEAYAAGWTVAGRLLRKA